MSVAPLPLFGERHLLQATQGICIGFTVSQCFMQKNEVLRGLATKNERLYTQNWFGNPSLVAHGQPDFDPCVPVPYQTINHGL